MITPSKYSHQREAIVSFLKTRNDHPTADIVYKNIRETIPNISLGTVYRNLNQLANSGVILRLTCGGKTDHYDACTEPHYHFICKDCGAVIDINMPISKELISNAKLCSGFNIDEVSVLFSGLCSDCKELKP